MEVTGDHIAYDDCQLCGWRLVLIEWHGMRPEYRYEWQHMDPTSGSCAAHCPGAPIATPVHGNLGFTGKLLPEIANPEPV